MPARLYGRTIEIDHIVSLELGGSNDIANLYPEPGSGRANYHVKDRLENKLHDLVCSGAMTLRAAQLVSRGTGRRSTRPSSDQPHRLTDHLSSDLAKHVEVGRRAPRHDSARRPAPEGASPSTHKVNGPAPARSGG